VRAETRIALVIIRPVVCLQEKVDVVRDGHARRGPRGGQEGGRSGDGSRGLGVGGGGDGWRLCSSALTHRLLLAAPLFLVSTKGTLPKVNTCLFENNRTLKQSQSPSQCHTRPSKVTAVRSHTWPVDLLVTSSGDIAVSRMIDEHDYCRPPVLCTRQVYNGRKRLDPSAVLDSLVLVNQRLLSQPSSYHPLDTMVRCLFLGFLFFGGTTVLAMPVVRYDKDIALHC
jgi:hypothetical protein